MSSNEPGRDLLLATATAPVTATRPALQPHPSARRGADDDDCLFVHNDVETSLNGQKSRIYSYD